MHSFGRRSNRSDYLNTYTPHWQRHVNHLVINGFFARDLDADDHAFLEYVRCRGLANGTLDRSDAYSLEEMAFWHSPYTLDESIPRRAAPVADGRMVVTPELRRARTMGRIARFDAKVANRKVVAAQSEREWIAWEAAGERRRLQRLIADAEWEAAGADQKRRSKLPPIKAKQRRYVPLAEYERELVLRAVRQAKVVQVQRAAELALAQWELAGQAAGLACEFAVLQRDCTAAALLAAKVEREAQERSALKAKLAAAALRMAQAVEAGRRKQLALAEAEKRRREREREQEAISRRLQAEQRAARAAARTAEQRAAAEEIAKAHQERLATEQAAALARQDKGYFKIAIKELIRGSYPTIWSLDSLMKITGCSDLDLMRLCLWELQHEGNIQQASGPKVKLEAVEP